MTASNLITAVKKLNCLACAHAQNATDVVGRVIGQGDLAAIGSG
jgi:hypothetical protein